MTLRKRIKRLLVYTVTAVVGLGVVAVVGAVLIVRALVEPDAAAFGTVEDEAKRAGLSRNDFRAASH
ncbi:hypothetical protein [Sinorhizobium sp. 6-117]|uniref:hypothetical protein n=1 Tax=Sinorhizobium sp. 6-117 TaxID=3049090 RepID=UPI0024C28FEB|nr:hypothetical protein [Sinorhizobium sp. 6-117]MDK1483182.1 hypothetical protein [Sinorhizobium sp. 6-117]